jgi:hypothetical protein
MNLPSKPRKTTQTSGHYQSCNRRWYNSLEGNLICQNNKTRWICIAKKKIHPLFFCPSLAMYEAAKGYHSSLQVLLEEENK